MPPYFDYREESETEEESGQSEEESSNDDKGIEDDSEDKMYINENKKIRTRNPPKSLANIMSKLTDAQIGTLKDMGFGSFIGYKINRVPTALARWLLLNYDPRTSVLQARDVKIKITSQTVHDIFGLPIGGKEIVEVNQAKKTDEVIEEWRVLYAQKCMPMVLKRSSTVVITKSTTRKLIMLQKEMIASNKKIIAHDTDIETHEIIAVKTTPEKERMTKSKIIAAKNAKEMIASNKKIIAPDTDIETHEIIAAETTLEKERMIKSKIIAAKNAVSQSPIKAVNFGDISGKASNGISNTPKDAQVNGFLMNKTDLCIKLFYN
ncbi:hypothetical protein Tco_1188200 [Tanacetum coccineum]